MEHILSSLTVSISELKKSPTKILQQSGGKPVAVLNHNKPAAYLVTPALFERIADLLEDLEDAPLVAERLKQPTVKVDLDAI